MRILFDGRVLDGTASGVRDVAQGLVRGFRALEKHGEVEFLIAATPETRITNAIRVPHRGFIEVGLPMTGILRRANRILIPRQTVPLISAVPAVPLFHDIGFLQVPELYPDTGRIAMTSRIAARGKYMLAVSRYTAAEMADRGLGRAVNALPIHAIHKLTWAPDASEKYVLCVAAQEPHKNLVRLIQAWQLADPQDVRLVICGRSGRDSSRIESQLADLSKRDTVEVRSGLGDIEYEKLLSKCWGYVQPSFYEGLCIPALDLAAAGAPIVVSRDSNLGAVFGTAPEGQLFNPLSSREMAASLTMLIEDEEYRAGSSQFNSTTVKMTDWLEVASAAVGAMK